MRYLIIGFLVSCSASDIVKFAEGGLNNTVGRPVENRCMESTMQETENARNLCAAATRQCNKHLEIIKRILLNEGEDYVDDY